MLETVFPRTDRKADDRKDQEDEEDTRILIQEIPSESGYCSYQTSEDGESDDEDDDYELDQQESLTYVPSRTSTYDKTDSSEEESGSDKGESDNDVVDPVCKTAAADEDVDDEPNGRYNLTP